MARNNYCKDCEYFELTEPERGYDGVCIKHPAKKKTAYIGRGDRLACIDFKQTQWTKEDVYGDLAVFNIRIIRCLLKVGVKTLNGLRERVESDDGLQAKGIGPSSQEALEKALGFELSHKYRKVGKYGSTICVFKKATERTGTWN